MPEALALRLESFEQEIQAKILLHNTAQAVCHQTHQSLPSDKQDVWQVNRADAIKQNGRVVIACFNSGRDVLSRYVGSLVEVRPKTLEVIRADRHFPRNHSIGGAQGPRKAYR